MYKCAQCSQDESEAQEEVAKWVGRPAGNSGFWGDGRRCQGWYTFSTIRAEDTTK